LDKFDTYHLGIETGGTSCKVGVMKGKSSLNIIKTNIIKTTTPEETVQNIVKIINESEFTFSSMGVAAFGPLCLDKTVKEYGSVTSTPKVAW
jgi:fructokinase